MECEISWGEWFRIEVMNSERMREACFHAAWAGWYRQVPDSLTALSRPRHPVWNPKPDCLFPGSWKKTYILIMRAELHECVSVSQDLLLK